MIFAPFSIPNPSKMPIIGHDFCSIFEPWHHRIAVPPHRRTAPHHRIAPPHHTTPPQCTTPSHHRSDRSPTYRWNFRIESAPYFRVEFDVFYHFFGRFCATFFVPFFFTFFVSFLIFFLTLFWYSFCPFFGYFFCDFSGHFFCHFLATSFDLFFDKIFMFFANVFCLVNIIITGVSASRGEPEHCTTASHHRHRTTTASPHRRHHTTTPPHRIDFCSIFEPKSIENPYPVSWFFFISEPESTRNPYCWSWFLLHFRTQILLMDLGSKMKPKSWPRVMIFDGFRFENGAKITTNDAWSGVMIFDGFRFENEAKIMTNSKDFWWI